MYFFSIYGPHISDQQTGEPQNRQNFLEVFRQMFTQQSNNNIGLPLSKLRETTKLELYEPESSEMVEIFQCSICHCDIQKGDIIRKINECSHIFHHQCIDQWFSTHQSCPLCRVSLENENVNVEEFTIPISFSF